jgi:hypothetical protein
MFAAYYMANPGLCVADNEYGAKCPVSIPKLGCGLWNIDV